MVHRAVRSQQGKKRSILSKPQSRSAALLKRKLMSNETNDYEAINQIVRRYPGEPELQAQLAEELGILDTYKVYLSR